MKTPNTQSPIPNHQYPITIPNPPTEAQLQYLYENGGRDKLTRLLSRLIDRALEVGLLVVRDGTIIPAGELQIAPEQDIITAPLMMMEVPR
jgi:hypothetical protein